MWCSSPFVIVWYDRVYDMIYDTTIKQWNDGLPRVPTTPLLTRFRSDAANVHDGGGGAFGVGYDAQNWKNRSTTSTPFVNIYIYLQDSWILNVIAYIPVYNKKISAYTVVGNPCGWEKSLPPQTINHIFHWLVLVVVVGRCHMCDVTVIWPYCHGESRNDFNLSLPLALHNERFSRSERLVKKIQGVS